MQAKNWKLGVSTCSWDHSPETLFSREMFKAYKEGGIDCLEISMRWCYYDQIDYKKAGKLSKEYGVDIWSFHLPFQPFAKTNPCSIDKEIRDITFNRFSDFIRIGADIGAKVFVVHPSGEDTPPEQREEHLKCGQEFFANLAEFASKLGCVIAVEDLPRNCLGNCTEEIKKLISADDRLRVCFDTNHLLLEDNAKFIKELGDKIVTLHVSDYDFLDEQHWLPYEGLNNWKQIISLLEDANYNGPWLYELGRTAPPTIKRRPLEYKDFRENYLALINGKTPEILGKFDDECKKVKYFETKQF